MSTTIDEAKKQVADLNARWEELKVAFGPFRDSNLGVPREAFDRLNEIGDSIPSPVVPAVNGLRA